MSYENKTEGIRLASPLFSGLVYTFIVMGITTIAASMILMLTDQDEARLTAYSYVIHGISVLTGSFVSGKRAGFKGWYYGALLGLLYGVIVLIIGFLSFDRGLDIRTLLFVGGAVLTGVVGGILGVNARK